MRHSKARNVIKRTFELLKIRWEILGSPSWYPIKIHNRIIIICSLIHNLIKQGMIVDPFIAIVILDIYLNYVEPDADPISNVKASC